MIGRVLRPAEGKPDAIILDHSGAVFRHGFAEDPVEWTLSPDRLSESAVHAARCEAGSKSRLLECSQCGAIRIAGEPCCACGFLPQRPPRPVPIGAGELAEVARNRTTTANVYDHATRMQWLGMFTAIAQERGWSNKFPTVNYKEKFGGWPPYGLVVAPIPPSPECRSWVRSRLIAYAKSRSPG
jgi:DNA repair protein RadD